MLSDKIAYCNCKSEVLLELYHLTIILKYSLVSG